MDRKVRTFSPFKNSPDKEKLNKWAEDQRRREQLQEQEEKTHVSSHNKTLIENGKLQSNEEGLTTEFRPFFSNEGSPEDIDHSTSPIRVEELEDKSEFDRSFHMSPVQRPSSNERKSDNINKENISRTTEQQKLQNIPYLSPMKARAHASPDGLLARVRSSPSDLFTRDSMVIMPLNEDRGKDPMNKGKETPIRKRKHNIIDSSIADISNSAIFKIKKRRINDNTLLSINQEKSDIEFDDEDEDDELDEVDTHTKHFFKPREDKNLVDKIENLPFNPDLNRNLSPENKGPITASESVLDQVEDNEDNVDDDENGEFGDSQDEQQDMGSISAGPQEILLPFKRLPTISLIESTKIDLAASDTGTIPSTHAVLSSPTSEATRTGRRSGYGFTTKPTVVDVSSSEEQEDIEAVKTTQTVSNLQNEETKETLEQNGQDKHKNSNFEGAVSPSESTHEGENEYNKDNHNHDIENYTNMAMNGTSIMFKSKLDTTLPFVATHDQLHGSSYMISPSNKSFLRHELSSHLGPDDTLLNEAGQITMNLNKEAKDEHQNVEKDEDFGVIWNSRELDISQVRSSPIHESAEVKSVNAEITVAKLPKSPSSKVKAYNVGTDSRLNWSPEEWNELLVDLETFWKTGDVNIFDEIKIKQKYDCDLQEIEIRCQQLIKLLRAHNGT